MRNLHLPAVTDEGKYFSAGRQFFKRFKNFFVIFLSFLSFFSQKNASTSSIADSSAQSVSA